MTWGTVCTRYLWATFSRAGGLLHVEAGRVLSPLNSICSPCSFLSIGGEMGSGRGRICQRFQLPSNSVTWLPLCSDTPCLGKGVSVLPCTQLMGPDVGGFLLTLHAPLPMVSWPQATEVSFLQEPTTSQGALTMSYGGRHPRSSRRPTSLWGIGATPICSDGCLDAMMPSCLSLQMSP